MLRGVLLGEGGWGPKGGGRWRRVRGEGRREVEADAGENGGVSVKAREELVALLRRRGVKDERVLGAMGRVPREVFVPSEVVDEAYRDVPLPIGRGQTISQPFIVAEMTAALAIEPGARVLEIGTGCGYQTAVLVELGAAVFTIELEPELGASARERLLGLGYHGVEFRVGDGSKGWPEAAPFDAILCAAAAREVPSAWLEQLAHGGRMCLPIGADGEEQELVLVVRGNDGTARRSSLGAVRFVPLRGG